MSDNRPVAQSASGSQAAADIARRLGLGRANLASVRMRLERVALCLMSARRVRTRGRILCYHSVGQPRFGVNDVLPDRFRRQIEIALECGYRFVTAREIAEGGTDPKTLAITFDDGASSVLTTAAPILRAHGAPFTVFVVGRWAELSEAGEWSAALSWRDLETLLRNGAEIGSHSMTHPNFAHIDEGRASEELVRSRRLIERRLGVACDAFAIPFGGAANWPATATRLAREAGYRHIYAQAEDMRPVNTLPRSFVTRHDNDYHFLGLLGGTFDSWQEWA